MDRTEFAEKIQMSYNLLSQYIGKNPTKNIGDETAEKIEQAFNKPKGFLDQSQDNLSKSLPDHFKCLYNFLKNCSLSVDSLNKSFTYNLYSIIKRSATKKHQLIQDKLIREDSNLNFSNCAMLICFDLDAEEQKFLVNGNLDGKKIKKFLEDFGINITSLNLLDLSQIQTLKDNRQLLAHGGSSFSEVGKQISWETLEANSVTIKELFNQSKTLLTDFCNTLDQEMARIAS